MKFNILLFLFVIQTINVSACTLRMRVTDRPPLTYQDAEEKWVGLEIELATALAEHLKCKLVFKKNKDWNRALHHLTRGNIDLISSISVTKKRARTIAFVGPIRDERVILVTKKSSKIKVESLEDLKQFGPKSIGLSIGSFYGKEFEEKLQTDTVFAKVFLSSINNIENSKRLKEGEILGFIGDYDQTAYLNHHDEDSKDFAINPLIINSAPVYFGLSKKSLSIEFILEARSAIKTDSLKTKFKEIVQRYQQPEQ